MNLRPRRDLSIDGADLVLVEAWRAPSGLGLGYFLSSGTDGDRRVELAAGIDLASLDEEAVSALWESAAPLTSTERRISVDGDSWLAQASGPVWAEGAAVGTLGVRLTCLTSERATIAVAGVRLDDLDEGRLSALVTDSASAEAG